MCTIILKQLDVLAERIFFVEAQNLFQDSNFHKSYFLSIRGYSWHKKIKKGRGEVATEVTTAKNQRKKETESN